MEIKPPYQMARFASKDYHKKRLFLAGTIDNGDSIDWQSDLAHFHKNELSIINPRREDWNKSWPSNDPTDPKVYQQVNWELSGIENADYVLFVILGDSRSAISLMELGLCCGAGISATVICEPNFYKYGNVAIMCERYGIPLFHSIEEYKEVQKPKTTKKYL